MYNSNQIYNQLLPKLEELEVLRTEVLAQKKKALTICLIMGLVIVVVSFAVMSSAGIAGIFVAIIGVIILLFIYNGMVGDGVQKFRSSYKHKVISEIAQCIEPSIVYQPDHGISQSSFVDVGHYSNRIDRYKTEDHFSGQVGDTSLSFAEVHAQYKTTSTDSNGKTRTTWHTLFKGVMFTADFHKNFNTWVTIKPDRESSLFGWVGTKMQKLSRSHIRMEDPDFEENFKVNAGDDQEARYILTPDMQQRLLAVKEEYGSGIIISFQRGCAYLTVPIKDDLFEGSLKESALSESQVHKISAQITHFLKLVEAMNLNTRIWTKE